MSDDPRDAAAETLMDGYAPLHKFVLTGRKPAAGENPVRFGRPPRPVQEFPDRPAERDAPTA